MTNLDIEKEAERIVEEIKQYFDTYRIPQVEQEAYKLSARKCIEHALRAVHDRAIEDAVKIAEDEDCVCTDEVNCNGNYRIADKVRAFKIGDGK